MPEGKTEPEVGYDDLMDHHSKWAAAEQDSNADAGVRRQQIGAFAEKTGLENKALSQFRAGMKIKNDGKRRDWLRSMQVLLPLAEQAITGNQSEMPLGEPADYTPAEEPQDEAVKPFDADAAA